MEHPCLSCGACCAAFRVSFYWRESEPTDNPNAVPKEKCVDLDSRYRCMKGTERGLKIRCQSLKGEIGKNVGCEIYESRPSPCRSFQASYENGEKNLRCDQARQKHDLPPLRKSDWLDFKLSTT